MMFSHALVEKVPFDEPPLYRYFSQILDIQPPCVHFFVSFAVSLTQHNQTNNENCY